MSTAEDLVQLIRHLELIEGGLANFDGQNKSIRQAGNELVSSGMLTQFQLDALLSGKGDRLRVGPYLLLDRIGAGGMGEVFLARHVRLGREVALKMIRQDKLENPKVVARFLRELRASALIEHPNVVRVFNAGQDSRHLYFSMQYVRGESLAKILTVQGPLSVPEACQAICDAAFGLQAVHSAGLVHRDIKPANLVRESATGRTKVLDLGLAGLTIRAADDSMQDTLTENGTVLGSHDYMSPEQALNAHSADSRSDLYSLGCTFVCLLTGRPPFAGRTPVEKLMAHVYSPIPDVRIARPDIPPELVSIVSRLLAKSPEDRYQSGAELAEALRSVASFNPTTSMNGEENEGFGEPFAFESSVAEEIQTEVSRPTHRVNWLVIVVSLFFAAIIGLAALITLLGNSTNSKSFPSSAVVITSADKLKALRASLAKPGAELPKLRSDFYALHAEHRSGPFGVTVAQALRSVPSTLDELKPSNVSRDKPSQVALRSAVGPRHWGAANSVAVSPDGATIATVGADRVVRLWSEKGKLLRVLSGFNDPLYGVTFSPNGKLVAATSMLLSATDSEGFERKARVWDVSTGELQLTVGKDLDWVISWHYSQAGDTALAGTYDRIHLRSATDGKVLKTFHGKSFGTNWINHAEFSRDGLHAIAACNNFHVHVWKISTGEEARAWKASDWYIDSFDRSPSEDNVLTVADGRIRIWDWTTGKKLSEYQFSPSPKRAVYSPDGKRLLFGCEDGRLGLIDIATTTRSELVLGHDGPVNYVAWDRSGKRAFSVGRDGNLRRWDVTGQKPVEIDPAPIIRPATALTFTNEDNSIVIARPGQPPEVWDIAASPSAVTTVSQAEEPGAVAISVDGRRVLTASGSSIVRVWPIPVGTSKDIEQNLGARTTALAWYPDSKRFLLATDDPRQELAAFDVASGKITGRLPLASAGVENLLAISTDGRWVAGSLRNGGVAWWDLTAGKVLAESPRHNPQSSLTSLIFSPGPERLLAIGSGWQVSDLPIAVTRTGRLLWDAEPRVPFVGAVSADASMIAVASKTGEITLLAETGKQIREWVLPGRVTALAFSVNGRYLAAAHSDGSIGVYRLQ